MERWDSITLKFDGLAPLEAPIKSLLVALEVIEAVFEAALAIVKAASVDILNPLSATISLLLAAVRLIINQIRSTGFSILAVHPDFSQPDFNATLQSVSGSYIGFEQKVISKFFDTADISRPTYPEGSAVVMLVLYIGADSPGDLYGQIYALLNLLKHPAILTSLPAPVNVKARPVNMSGSPIARAQKLFDSDLDKALMLEWQMPSSSPQDNGPSFVNQTVSFVNSFRFPNFIVERSEKSFGDPVTVEIKASPVVGGQLKGLQKRFEFVSPEVNVTVREPDGMILRHFSKKFPISKERGLIEGQLSGTYRYLDDDFEEEDRGKTFYYRIRAYFGTPTAYIEAKTAGDYKYKEDGSTGAIYDFGSGNIIGSPSAIIPGFVPRNRQSSLSGWSPYKSIYEAVQAGLLLNFELPGVSPGDSDVIARQKTGWGTLSSAGRQIAALKGAWRTSTKLKESLAFKTMARRVAHEFSVAMYRNPAISDIARQRWFQATTAVDTVLNTDLVWSFVSVNSGINDAAIIKINNYLALEEDTSRAGTDESPLLGPFPIVDDDDNTNGLSVENRKALADFLSIALNANSRSSSYLSWYSVTLGDLIPAFIPFIFSFEQFILALLQAVQSALAEIEAIIQTILTKIEQLEAILRSILALIDLLDIRVSLSILTVDSNNGSAQFLAESIMNSEDKPSGNPYGYYSGLVITAGGPGVESFRSSYKFLFKD